MKQKGFTIIELIVVIAILAVLAGIVVSSVRAYNAKANNAAVLANINQIQKALEIYKSQYGKYPYQAQVNGDSNYDDTNYKNGLDAAGCTGGGFLVTFINMLKPKLVNTGIIGQIQGYANNLETQSCYASVGFNNWFEYETDAGMYCNGALVTNKPYVLYVASTLPLSGFPNKVYGIASTQNYYCILPQ